MKGVAMKANGGFIGTPFITVMKNNGGFISTPLYPMQAVKAMTPMKANGGLIPFASSPMVDSSASAECSSTNPISDYLAAMEAMAAMRAMKAMKAVADRKAMKANLVTSLQASSENLLPGQEQASSANLLPGEEVQLDYSSPQGTHATEDNGLRSHHEGQSIPQEGQGTGFTAIKNAILQYAQ